MKKLLLGLFFAMFAMQVNAATYTMYNAYDGMSLNAADIVNVTGGPSTDVLDSQNVLVGDNQTFTRWVTVTPTTESVSFGGGTQTPGNVSLNLFTVTNLTDNTFVSGVYGGAGDSIKFASTLAANVVYEMVLNFDVTGTSGNVSIGVSAVPVPAAVWLFGSALMGLVGVSRRKSTAVAA